MKEKAFGSGLTTFYTNTFDSNIILCITLHRKILYGQYKLQLYKLLYILVL